MFSLKTMERGLLWFKMNLEKVGMRGGGGEKVERKRGIKKIVEILICYLLAVGVETAIVAGKEGEKVVEWLELPNGCVSFSFFFFFFFNC
jgi:hypothetical protein